jgi:F-type H+-transporting ATPase subunit delta
MPLSHAQPTALANVYARSLLELCAQQGREAVEEAQSQLEDILELARANPKFAELLSSRVISTKARKASLEKIFKGKVADGVYRFLQVLNDKGRLANLPAISAAFDQLVLEKFGRVEVDVFTAQPIDGGTSGAIRDRLQNALKKDVVVHSYTDEAMIGGIKLRIGDQLIDGSVAAQLRQMRDKINVDGMANLRSRFDRISGE